MEVEYAFYEVLARRGLLALVTPQKNSCGPENQYGESMLLDILPRLSIERIQGQSREELQIR